MPNWTSILYAMGFKTKEIDIEKGKIYNIYIIDIEAQIYTREYKSYVQRIVFEDLSIDEDEYDVMYT